MIAFVHGGYADFAVAPVELVSELPATLDYAIAVSFLVQGVTAWQLLHDCGRVQAGESVLVHSAAGGVGTLAVQLARTLGATTVVATAGSPEKCRLALELGADVALDYSEPGWPERVLEATGARGVDVVLDAVGGDVGELSLTCLAPFGRLVVYGVASKRLASVRGIAADAAQPVGRRVLAHQSARGGIGRRGRRGEGRARATRAGGDRPIHGVVRHAFPLEQAGEAHRAVSDRRTVGKVVLTT